MLKVHRNRLLRVAQDLRNSPAPRKFTMRFYGHSCGTPACALGHYAAAKHRGSPFRLGRDGVLLVNGRPNYPPACVAADHFGLSDDDELEALFGPLGCGRARTPIQAAKYIEAFVARKEREAKS